ncbi:hypothetical protein [Tardiphaga robiniae]|uniref:hypothetical protein n=1 Tax=Tardiphaga robiniae TaxID=943830 RepID=UPI001FCDE296|nr:hypothetical protein [Tardiphaga robiniae]
MIVRSGAGAASGSATPSARASFPNNATDGTVSDRSIFEIIDRLTPDRSESCCRESLRALR